MLWKVFAGFWVLFLGAWGVALLGAAYLRAGSDATEALAAGASGLVCLALAARQAREARDPASSSNEVQRMADAVLARVARVRAEGLPAGLTLREARFVADEEDGYRHELVWDVRVEGRPPYVVTMQYWADEAERAALRPGLQRQGRVDPQDGRYVLIDWGDGTPR